jgi:hypothetical protein
MKKKKASPFQFPALKPRPLAAPERQASSSLEGEVEGELIDIDVEEHADMVYWPVDLLPQECEC